MFNKERLAKLEEVKKALPDIVFEVFKDGVLALNYMTKMGTKIKTTDFDKSLKDIVSHINKNTYLIN